MFKRSQQWIWSCLKEQYKLKFTQAFLPCIDFSLQLPGHYKNVQEFPPLINMHALSNVKKLIRSLGIYIKAYTSDYWQ